jgi:hypothetical protein
MIITTSWDDGHPLDIKVLELIEKYNLKATFYVPLSNPENPVMGQSMLQEISTFQEIGGHTVSHVRLNSQSDRDAEYEITQCKIILEDIIGRPITAFCFPGGKFTNRDVLLIKKAGYLFGRTAKLLANSKPQFNLLNTSIQIYNHSSATLLYHCMKNLNALPIQKNSFFFPFNKNFLKLAEYNILQNIDSDCVFHIWGHSWEIDRYNLWKQLEDLFKLIASCEGVTFLNNTQAWMSICENSNSKIAFVDKK